MELLLNIGNIPEKLPPEQITLEISSLRTSIFKMLTMQPPNNFFA